MRSSSAFVFILSAIISVENYPNKEYNCPKVDRNVCTETPSYENQDLYECIFDYNCGYGRKCCNHCRYGYKICTEVGLKNYYVIDNHEYLMDKYCPNVKPCAKPLKYDFKYYCSSDEACPYGSKCCSNSCYTHKVCVVPIDSQDNEIIPPPTTLRFLRTSVMNKSGGFGSGYTDDTDDDGEDDDDDGSGSGDGLIVLTKPCSHSRRTSIHTNKSKWRLTTIIKDNKFQRPTQRPIELGGSGDGFSDDDDDGEDDYDNGSTSNDNTAVQTSPFSKSHPTTLNTRPFVITITKENKFPRTTQRPIEFSGSGDGFSDDDGEDDDDNGSGSDDVTNKNRFQRTTQRPIEFSGSGDGFSDDDGDDNDDNGSDSDKVLVQAKPLHSHRTTSKSRPCVTIITNNHKLHTTAIPIEFSGSGDEDLDDAGDGSGSGSGVDNSEVGLVNVKQPPPSLASTDTSSDFIFYDENHYKLSDLNSNFGFTSYDEDVTPILTPGYVTTATPEKAQKKSYNRRLL